MEHGFKWLNNLTDRIFNKYTPKGLATVIVAIALQQLGASDDLIALAMKYEWNFIYDILALLKPFSQVIYWASIVLLMIGGFWLLKRNHDTIKLRNIEIGAKQVIAENEKRKAEIELAKLDCELHNMKCNVSQIDTSLVRMIEEEKLLTKLTYATIRRTKADMKLIKLKNKLEKNNEIL